MSSGAKATVYYELNDGSKFIEKCQEYTNHLATNIVKSHPTVQFIMVILEDNIRRDYLLRNGIWYLRTHLNSVYNWQVANMGDVNEL